MMKVFGLLIELALLIDYIRLVIKGRKYDAYYRQYLAANAKLQEITMDRDLWKQRYLSQQKSV